jgi:RNA recognition motif-containing protein
MSRISQNQKPVVDLENWVNSKNGSIFIKYIPNEMNKTSLYEMFDQVGKIERIDIVNIGENGSGRRAFVHFSEWKNTNVSLNLRREIASSYPIHIPFFYNNFEYSITLNSRPIPKSTLNCDQLTEMNQRLNDELVDCRTEYRKEVAELKEENGKLRKITDYLMNEMKNMKESIQFMSPPLPPQFYQQQFAYGIPLQYYSDEFISEYEECLDFDQSYINFNPMNSEFPNLTESDLIAMEEFEDEINRIHMNPEFDHKNQVEIEKAIFGDLGSPPSEMSFVDLDDIEAGLRRPRVRDPLIYHDLPQDIARRITESVC